MSKSFNLNAQGFFLTYPHCTLTKDEVQQQLEKCGTIVNGVIAVEQHEDGTPHVHAYVRFEKKKHVRQATFFDLKKDTDVFHGNYQTARNTVAVAKYCKKDGDYKEIGDIDVLQEQSAREGHRKILGKRLCQGETLVDLIDEGHHHLIFDFNKLQNNLKAYQELKKREKPTCQGEIPNSFGVHMPLVMGKQKHYWLWSNMPNQGKTTFLKEIAYQFRSSWYSTSEIYQDVHADSQFILLDEFSSPTLKVTQLNQMCDGTFNYPLKGGAAKQVNAILICCGNKHPREIYPNAWPFVEARFNVIELGVPAILRAPHQVIKQQPKPVMCIDQQPGYKPTHADILSPIVIDTRMKEIEEEAIDPEEAEALISSRTVTEQSYEEDD